MLDRSPTRSPTRPAFRVSGSVSSMNPGRGDYAVPTLGGRSTPDLDRRVTNRTGRVENHAGLALHVWHLVAKALTAMRYGEWPNG
jgi:hypothetical protein